ncbi:hypothetical protein [Terasakiella pusilla]|uniref:hypothetical protein n=1 Tax=Terasakiella pusilla TaxID=64973 RepID=UPI003AA92E28
MKSYSSMQELQLDKGGNYTTGAKKDGKIYCVKDISGLDRTTPTGMHEIAARKLGYEILKIERGLYKKT